MEEKLIFLLMRFFNFQKRYLFHNRSIFCLDLNDLVIILFRNLIILQIKLLIGCLLQNFLPVYLEELLVMLGLGLEQPLAVKKRVIDDGVILEVIDQSIGYLISNSPFELSIV